ncbi:MAG: hypothetical protein JSS75_10435 [Bacteroidetes bacterium]|nr:hypothetical protein [Bacteroidota bacterium]
MEFRYTRALDPAFGKLVVRRIYLPTFLPGLLSYGIVGWMLLSLGEVEHSAALMGVGYSLFIFMAITLYIVFKMSRAVMRPAFSTLDVIANESGCVFATERTSHSIDWTDIGAIVHYKGVIMIGKTPRCTKAYVFISPDTVPKEMLDFVTAKIIEHGGSHIVRRTF